MELKKKKTKGNNKHLTHFILKEYKYTTDSPS